MFNTSSLTTALNTTTTTNVDTDDAVNLLMREATQIHQGLKLPLVCVTPFGTISIMMAHNVNVEISVDRSLRLVCWNKFSISSNQKCTKSGILHSFGHIMQDNDKLFCYFYPGTNYAFSNKDKQQSPSPQGSPVSNSGRQPPSLLQGITANGKLQGITTNGNGTGTNAGTNEGNATLNIEKMAILGTQGVLFSMSHLMDAFLVSAAAASGTSALSMERIQFPSLRNDYTLRQFYTDSKIGDQNIVACNQIVQRARYEKKEGMLFSLSINGFLIRQKEDGDVEIFCRPRQIYCSPTRSTVHLRCSNVEMEVQEDEKAYVKCSAKRVHVSRSGMVVSDGNYTTSMDHFGRIVSAS